MIFLINLVATETCSFRLVLKRKSCKQISELSNFLKRVLKNRSKKFALSEAKGNLPEQLNKLSVADLPFLRTLLAILQES